MNRRQRPLTTVLAGVGALLSLVVVLFPLYAVVIASFQTDEQLIGARFNFWPPSPTLENYRGLLETQSGHIASTLLIGLGTAVLTLAISLPAAHLLARYRFRVTVFIIGGLLVAQILPSIVIANSLFLLYHRLGLLNTYPGLILADASYAVPFAILVVRAFMLGLPADVLQAAQVDGAVALAMALTACSGSDPGGGGGSGGKVTLRLLDYYTAGGGKTAVDSYIEKFEASHPNVDVKRESVPFENLMPKVLQAASAGDMPEIVIIDNPNIQQVAATGQLRVFDELSGYTTQGYYPGAVKECEFQGKHYCYPVGHNSVGLFYNKKMLDDAGVEPPTTWAELSAAAEKLTKGSRHGMAVSAPADEQSTWQLEPFAWSSGATMTKVDSPQWVQALQLWTDWVDKGHMSKSVIQWGQSPDLPQQFLKDKFAMMINGPWIFPLLTETGWEYNKDYGIVKVPVQQAGQKVVAPLGGETWALGNSGSDEQKNMAWEFVKGTQDNATMVQMTKEMFIIPTKPAATAEFLKGGEQYEVFAEQSLTARPRTIEYGANYPKVSQAVWTAIQSAITGTKSPQEALTEAQQTVASVPQQGK